LHYRKGNSTAARHQENYATPLKVNNISMAFAGYFKECYTRATFTVYIETDPDYILIALVTATS
jgi:hypothetical protein